MFDFLYYISSIVDIGLTCVILYAVVFKHRKGISLNAQILHGSAHLLRTLSMLINIRDYWALDTFSFLSECIVQIFYIASSCFIVYTLYMKKREMKNSTSYASANPDFIEWQYLFVPAIIIGSICNLSQPWQIFYMVSFWVDAVADLPQIYMIYSFSKSQKGKVDNFVADYVFLLSTSRMGFFLSYIIYGHISYGLLRFIEWQIVFMQLLRLAVYADFVYKYVRYRFYGEKEAFLIDELDAIL